MVAEIISVGTELLMGNIINTNAAYISKRLADLGVSVYYQTTVGDNVNRLVDAVNLALSRADMIICSGGLGPTEDDLTKETVAKALDVELVMDQHTRDRIENYFTKFLKKDITDNNWKQAYIPEAGAGFAIDNHNGTAPGIIFEKNDKIAILLPGPPYEMKPMFEDGVVPYLKSKQPTILYSKMIKTCGIGESGLETRILDLIDNQTNPTIAPYAKLGEVHLRVTASASSLEEGEKLVEPVVEELRKRLGRNIFTEDENETLEEAVVKMLIDNKLTITTAESCTGGLMSGRLVNVAGASACLNEAYVTYSNEAKMKLLGVSEETLRLHGAVSEETAYEMALGAAKNAGADCALSATGIAGPGGGSEEKPVGLVYVGCHVKGVTRVRRFVFSGNRENNRNHTVECALIFLRDCLLDVVYK